MQVAVAATLGGTLPGGSQTLQSAGFHVSGRKFCAYRQLRTPASVAELAWLKNLCPFFPQDLAGA
ncbi:hypothetical protein CSE6_024_40510 [Comamonas sp. E6]|nr:hypothetical protein CSE6_024_40510 [Comamonas sp. E6]